MTAGSDIERLTFYVRLWSSKHEKITAIIWSMERQKSTLPRTWERAAVVETRFGLWRVSPVSWLHTLQRHMDDLFLPNLHVQINTYQISTNKTSNGTINASSTRPADALCCSWKPASELQSQTARDHYVLSLRPPVAEPRNKRWWRRKMIMFIITCDAREDH